MRPAEAHELAADCVFVDVRESYEYDAGHIHDAVHMSIGEIMARAGELPRDRPIVVTCQIGQRSALVAEHLRGLGLIAHNLEGGLEAWVALGLLLTASEDAVGRVVDGWARDLSGRRLDGN